ncbi:YcxB family protein [Flavisolibacter tropicus]|uniref:YcxB-like C-terminal domain-containing protein n=1 Tax=Flavisolibacter tropicus TaxID=1492898 RepID=A0A172TW41_9BACT|nr:YcxB family protein [Flavisolibacter tropicus]ANE51114.1 hypothetical protein SY85_11985 [Flavisolibacter tropicus]
MTVNFSYDKRQVLQALRFHFLSRPEIRVMIILVNVFALFSAALFYFKKVTPLAFLIGSLLWIFIMISIWFVLPGAVYRRAATFRDHFTMEFENDFFSLGNERGSRSWQWSSLTKFIETPNFFHLYFDPRSFFLVPKSSFGSSDAIFEIRQLFKEKIQKKA